MNDIVPHTPTNTPRQGGALSLSHMSPESAKSFANALAGSRLLPPDYRGDPASVLWALEYGRELGIGVVTTVSSVHVINGKPTASADLMASLTRRAGHRMRITGDDTHAEVHIFRADDPEFAFTCRWDMDKAHQAGLTKSNTWKSYPAAMLRARAISECVRMACPEVMHGTIYTPEELGAPTDAEGNVIPAPQAAPATTPQLQRDWIADANNAATADDVLAIWRKAGESGAIPDVLDKIVEIGKKKRAKADKQVTDAVEMVTAEQEASLKDWGMDADTIAKLTRDEAATALTELNAQQ